MILVAKSENISGMEKFSIRKVVVRCATCGGSGGTGNVTCSDCAGIGEKDPGIVTFYEGSSKIAVCVRSQRQDTTSDVLPMLGMQRRTRPFVVLSPVWLDGRLDPGLLGVRAKPSELAAALERGLAAAEPAKEGSP